MCILVRLWDSLVWLSSMDGKSIFSMCLRAFVMHETLVTQLWGGELVSWLPCVFHVMKYIHVFCISRPHKCSCVGKKGCTSAVQEQMIPYSPLVWAKTNTARNFTQCCWSALHQRGGSSLQLLMFLILVFSTCVANVFWHAVTAQSTAFNGLHRQVTALHSPPQI